MINLKIGIKLKTNKIGHGAPEERQRLMIVIIS